MLPDISTILLSIAFILFVCTIARGIMAWRKTEQEALTIEEGLEVIKKRVIGRDFLQTAIVVALVSVLMGGLYWGLLSSAGWVSFATALSIALMCVTCVFMIVTWLRRSSTDQIVQMLSQNNQSEDVTPKGHLHRLLRTYRYYNTNEKKPGLFDWVRRQLGLYILGMDIQAYIPISTHQIAKNSGLLIISILLIATLLNFTIRFNSPIGVNFSEVPSSSEVNKEKEDIEKPGADGETIASEDVEETRRVTPNDQVDEDQPENLASAESETPVSENKTEIPEGQGESVSNEKPVPNPSGENIPKSPEESSQPGEGWFAELMDKVRDYLPGGDDEPSPGDNNNPDEPSTDMAGLAPGDQNEAGTSGETPSESADPGQQSSAQAQLSAESGEVSQGESLPSTSDKPSELSSDQGAGESNRPRISRGSGPQIQGQATEVATDVPEDAVAMQINVDQELSEKPGHESEQPLQPNQYNAALTLNPDDVNVTTADPLQTQRIPKSYEQTLKRLLSKP